MKAEGREKGKAVIWKEMLVGLGQQGWIGSEDVSGFREESSETYRFRLTP